MSIAALSLADLARRLADAGTPMEAIIMALEAVEAEQTRSAEGRAKAAERKRRQRERDADGAVTRPSQDNQGDNHADGTVTGQSQDSHGDHPLSRPPNDIYSNPPTQTPGNITARETANEAGNVFPRPDGVDRALWADFRANRKAKKLSNTASAYAKFQRDLAAECARTGWPPGDVLRACVERGWGAIYKITEQNNGQQRQSGHRGGSTRDAARLALERLGQRMDERTGERMDERTGEPMGVG